MAQRPSYASISHRESFTHERLVLAENSIRLFQVQRGDKNDPISLRITQYSSHRRPPYRAISYTWGSSANLRDILVNGRVFRIHYNLWNLLFHLRLKKETAFLWADALCIDQANLKERSFHVQLMGRIYDQAKSVIVWLGLPSPDRIEIQAMNFIREFTAHRGSKGDAEVAQISLAPIMHNKWESLSRMCQHQYWTRTWIVQEFLRACDVEVLCGSASIDWNEFENLLVCLQKAPFNVVEVISRILHSRPARLTLRRRARTASTLHELLNEYHDSMCTEQRDKIYGILGLASDCGEDEVTGKTRGLVPDYLKHIVEVYLDAVACIHKTLSSSKLLPSVTNLVRQTLLLSDHDLADYARRKQSIQPYLQQLTVEPTYVGTVENVLPSWTSIRDLKLQLASVDWGQYMGYEVKSSGAGIGRRSSARVSHSAIPEDMLQNMINVAETESEVAYLHNYPCQAQIKVPLEQIALHSEDKRLFNNSSLDKPRVIIEHNQVDDTLRLGFACTNTRRGDVILQFQGLDVTLICRSIGHDFVLVGKAIMVRHSQLEQSHKLDSVCVESPWFSSCLRDQNPDGFQLETDALSLAELLARR